MRLALRWMMLGLIGLSAGGCAGGGFLAHAAGGGGKKVEVKARYHGLEGRTLAVFVAANDYLLYQHPDAAANVCTAVTNRIAASLPTVTVVPPQEVTRLQEANPYWSTMAYEELIKKVGVDRIVLIDLSEYRLHEPGNVHVWQGYISGDVGVLEAETAHTDTLAFREQVSARYPEQELGDVKSDRATIEIGLLALFSRDAAGLFYDHTIEVKK